MHCTSILLAFVASLVTGAPLEKFPEPPNSNTFYLLNTSSIVVPGNAPGVVFPEYQSTPGHTWPLIQCKPWVQPVKVGGWNKIWRHFACRPGLLGQYGYGEVAIVTWNDKIKVGKSCDPSKPLPLSWVCMNPDGTNNLIHDQGQWHMQRGFWKDMDCYKHYNHESCHYLEEWKEWVERMGKEGMHMQEIVDENGVEWDDAHNEDGGQGW